MARISTHVLDTARGQPAAGIVVQLYRGVELLREATTNADGRTDQPLFSAEELTLGHYEVRFHVSSYLPQPSFFDLIRIGFVVSDARGNYHVPLLLSPFGYSVYRGS